MIDAKNSLISSLFEGIKLSVQNWKNVQKLKNNHLTEANTAVRYSLMKAREPGWEPIASKSGYEIDYNNLNDYVQKLEICRKIYRDGQFIRRAIFTCADFVVGTGINWSINSYQFDNKELAAKLNNEIITKFINKRNWKNRERQIFIRLFRDGEVFIRKFNNSRDFMDVRFVEPEFVKEPVDPQIIAPFGVQFQNLPFCDIENIKGYWLELGRGMAMIPSDEMFHIKEPGDAGNSLRGLSPIWAVVENSDRADRLLSNMNSLAMIHSKFAVIERFKSGTPYVNVANIVNNRSNNLTQNVNNESIRVMDVGNGASIVSTVGGGYELDFPSVGINPNNYEGFYDKDIRAIAAQFGLPFEWVGMDLQSTNRASMLEGKEPTKRMFEAQQSYFIQALKPLMLKAIENEIGRGNKSISDLKNMDEFNEKFYLEGKGPNLEVQDLDKRTERLTKLYDRGIISRQTFLDEEGFNSKQEDILKKLETPAPNVRN